MKEPRVEPHQLVEVELGRRAAEMGDIELGDELVERVPRLDGVADVPSLASRLLSAMGSTPLARRSPTERLPRRFEKPAPLASVKSGRWAKA